MNSTTDTAATLANMRAVEAQGTVGVFAFSPHTGEQYSASSGDYFTMREDDVLRDEMGEPMVLVFARTEYMPALGNEA